jgi:stage II sporulation protein D
VPSPGDDAALASSWGRTSWQWTTEYSAPQLRAYLAPRGIDVGDVQRIDITKVTGTGRVAGARVVGSSGTREITKDSSRYYFGLRSTLFTVAVRPEETENVPVSDADRIRQLDLLGAIRVRPVFQRMHDPEAPFRMVAWRYRVPARFVFSGKGFGHGVGMSQWGAQGMALRGASFEEILRHYYTGISLTPVGGA